MCLALAPSARQRHLQIWMRGVTEQAYLSGIGLGGQVPPVAGDSLGVVVNNASANKIEWFLHRRIAYDATVDAATGTVNSVATITLRNDAPPAGLPEYIIGNQVEREDLPLGTSKLYVSLYSPLVLRSVSVDGVPVTLTGETELGRNVYAGWVTIPAMRQVVITAGFSGPLPTAASGQSGYRLDVFAQPMVNPDELAVRVTSPGRALLAGKGLTASPSGELTGSGASDRVQTFEASYR